MKSCLPLALLLLFVLGLTGLGSAAATPAGTPPAGANALVPAGTTAVAPAAHAAASAAVAAPAFSLPTRTGTVSLDSLQGKVVLVDFWASWCEPCRKSFPWMSGLQERYGAKGLVIVAINLDKNRKAADAFLEKYPVAFPVAFDPSGKTAEAFKVAAMPSSFVIGPSGSVLYAHTGFDPKKTGSLESVIREACTQ